MHVDLLSGQVFSPFGESRGRRYKSSARGGIVGSCWSNLWLRAGVGSAVRALVIHGYDGRWALGTAGGGVA